MNKTKTHSPLEKVILYIGLFIIVGLLTYLILQSVHQETAPPDLKISTQYRAELPQTTFQIKIKNKGNSTAAGVEVQFDLYLDGKPIKSTPLSIDYVPVHSEKTAWVVFYLKKKRFDSLMVSSVSYKAP